MAKKVVEETVPTLDDSAINELPLKEVAKEQPIEKENIQSQSYKQGNTQPIYNCLKNARVIVRHIPKENGLVHNPKHVLYGGMAENTIKTFTVPLLSSGMYVNVLTDKEKDCLEEVMGLEYNALSVYKKGENNFWCDANPNGISQVRLTKQDTYLDLSTPEGYIKYKILLANRDYIAPSLSDLQSHPKMTYQFVIIEEGEEDKTHKAQMSATMQCYKEFGKIEDDSDTLRVIIETIKGKPIASTSKIEFLQVETNKLIQANAKLFLSVISDPLLSTKVLITKAIENKIISRKGDYLYLREDNSPLCNANEEPTLNVAAKYLSNPKNQVIKFSIEAKLKD